MNDFEIPVTLQDWPLQEKDITHELCKRCGLCCELTIACDTDDPRQLEFYRAVVENNPEITFIDGTLSIRCSHLRQTTLSDSPQWECDIYEDRPQLCKDYNCVSWAKVSNDTSRYDQVLEIAGNLGRAARERLLSQESDYPEGLRGPDT